MKVERTNRTDSAGAPLPGHFDVLIVGAGISGIGSAYHLQRDCPALSFAILETQESFGGTWLTHRYPGARSDSDLYTFGYSFKPWIGPPIATAKQILDYLGAVIAENDLGPRIRYRHRILAARWSSERKLWSVDGVREDTGETFHVTAGFLWMCQGYYRHDAGHMPDWPGMADFRGRIVHPQTWPDDLDLEGKRVVVIGSGATAATLIPAIAADAAEVTMLQRSPTYFIPARNANALADTLRELKIDETWIHEIVRRKVLFDQANFTRRAFEEPEAVRGELLEGVRACLGPDHPVEPDFAPTYRPWRQRIAFVPDADLFRAIRSGKARVVTDRIERFTAAGIRLVSGRELAADVIVAATGFEMNALGDIAFEIDGRPLDFAGAVTWRGMMFTGLPNLAWVFGYFRASWTLRVDLVAGFVCRLLHEMRRRDAGQVEVALRPEDRAMALKPWVDTENFNPGYLMRALDLLPRRGDKPEWQHSQDYELDSEQFPAIDLADPVFVYR